MLTKVKSRNFLLQLMQIDLFATTPSLNYRKGSHYTFCGFLLTLVIVGFLGYTFIIQVYGAFTSYGFRSVTTFDPNNQMTIEPIHIICLEPQSGTIPIVDASRYIYAELHPNKTPIPIQVVEQTSQQLCVSVKDPLEVPEGQLLSFVIQESEFTTAGINNLGLTFKYQLLAVVDGQSYPVGYYSMVVKEKYDLTATAQNVYYTLNEAYYWIDRGFLWSTPKEHTALEFDKSSTTPNPRTFVTEGTNRNFGVHLGFGGQITKNFLTSYSLGEILSNVGGLMSSLMVIIGFVFTSFFQFKYYENLLKGMRIRGYLSNYSLPDAANDGSSPLKSFETRRLDDSEIGAINLKSATESKLEAPVKDIQISLWGFLLYKSIIGKLLVRICPKRLVNTKQKAQVEALEAWEEQFSSRLDVMELLGKYLKTNNDNNNNKMTVLDIESSPIKRVGSDMDSSPIKRVGSDMDSSPIKPASRPTRAISPAEVEGQPAQMSNKP